MQYILYGCIMLMFAKIPSMKPWYEKADALRRAKKITLMDIASAIGVTEGAVGHYMSGRRCPDLTKIKRIAKVLDTSVAELIENDPYFIHSQQEREIVDIFRDIPESQREIAKKMLASLKATSE